MWDIQDQRCLKSMCFLGSRLPSKGMWLNTEIIQFNIVKMSVFQFRSNLWYFWFFDPIHWVRVRLYWAVGLFDCPVKECVQCRVLKPKLSMLSWSPIKNATPKIKKRKGKNWSCANVSGFICIETVTKINIQQNKKKSNTPEEQNIFFLQNEE